MESKNERGAFIVFEGIDGSGKSTQARLLAKRLEESGKKVHLTFEPTNYRIGSILRRILTGAEDADEHTIAALFLADRMDHINHPEYGMLSLLEKGTTVICDRYYYSSYAYHSQHMDMDWVIKANSIAADILRPDCVIFMDISPEAAMERIQQNRAEVEHYEKVETLAAVRKNYLAAMAKEGAKDNVHSIDATNEISEIQASIWNVLSAIL